MDVTGLISKSAYARHRGVSPAQVTYWLKGGRIKIVDGKVDRDASDAMLLASVNPGHGGKRYVSRPDDDPATTVPEAVIQEKQATTALKKLKLEREAGRLVEKVLYDLATQSAFAALRDQLLGISRRLGSRLAADGDAQSCTDIIAEEVTKVLNAAAEAQDALADSVGETSQ